MLGAIDDRVVVLAPVCMVSHSMQGGCLCENAPGLRVKYSNMEIAAAAAPRPQLLVATTGDWTKDTPTIEGPAIEAVYHLFGASGRLRHVRFDFGHNYNQTSRETVYAWFERWLLHQADAASSPEQPYPKDAAADLRVWPDGSLPTEAVTDEQLITRLIARRRAQVTDLLPRKRAEVEPFKETMLPLWRHTLQVEWPRNDARLHFKPLRSGNGFTAAEFELSRPGEPGALLAVYFRPSQMRTTSDTPPKLVLLAHEDGARVYCDSDQAPAGLARALVGKGCGVIVITQFTHAPAGSPFAGFYTTYNRTELQHRVRDLLAVCASAGTLAPGQARPPRLILCGEGRAGPWVLLAAPGADVVVADFNALHSEDDSALLTSELFCPGFRSLGGFSSAALLAAPNRLWLHNTGEGFDSAPIRQGYKALSRSHLFRQQTAPAKPEQLLRWIERL